MKKVLAIIPAHNEERKGNIPLIMGGLKDQTHPTDICIVSDNSDDNTVQVATELGATFVTETVNNTGMRAGAINQGIEHFAEGYDYILAMDADSKADPHMIEEGVKALEEDPKLGAVCSRAGVLPQPELKSFSEKFLWYIQHLEYGDYDSSRVETTNRIKVAHGLSTLFRRETLDQQIKKHGHVYNNDSLTEDYWLTMDLKELGWNVTSCQKMKAWTIVPTKFEWLWKQRTRWNLGGIDTILAHGLNRITFWDTFAHVMGAILLLIEILVVSIIVYIVSTGQHVYFSDLFKLIVGLMWFNGMYRCIRYTQNPNIWDILMRAAFIPSVLYYYFCVATQLNAYNEFRKGVKRSY